MELYKKNCFYYDEVHIPTCCCEINQQGLGWCKCENCKWYISNTEVAKVVRNYIIDRLWRGQGNL